MIKPKTLSECSHGLVDEAEALNAKLRFQDWSCWPQLFQNLGNFVYPALHVSFGGDTNKSVSPFYLESMPGDVKDATHRLNV